MLNKKKNVKKPTKNAELKEDLKEEKEEARSLRRKLKDQSKKLQAETRKAVITAVVAAFGFLMALAWRDVISEYVKLLVEISPVQGKLISATIVTIIAVVGIMIVTRFNVKEEGK